MDDLQAHERVSRVETLLEQVEELPDPIARESCLELVGALLDLYGEGLARIVERMPETASFTDDELVTHLLLVHGIHPVAVETRVRGALDEVRPYLESHGGGVQLLGIEDGIVRLRLEGSCDGCPSSSATLSLAVEEAIRKAAPEIEAIHAEEEQPPSTAKAAAGSVATPLVQLEPIAPRENGSGAWATAGVLPQLRAGGTLVKEVAGEPVLFLELDGTHYAYRPVCPACDSTLGDAPLNGSELECRGCGHRFDVRLAGRCTDEPGIHLDPVPLLVDDSGLIKVALASAA